MSTSLFDKIIFGPIKSRRLGISLGVNLLPTYGKICNFNCIYCECGWNEQSRGQKLRFNDKDDVVSTLEAKLGMMSESGEGLDVITFAGNGEPTMHPDFDFVVSNTVELRNRYYPLAKVAVLTNATMLKSEKVRNALSLVDRPILKIDSANESTIKLLNQPNQTYSLSDVIENIKLLKGEKIIQTMFLRGEYNGNMVDNTTTPEIEAWLDVLRQIKPDMVMIYSIDRDTPADNLGKIGFEELNKIATFVRELGIECSVA
ncbi:MAG: radical SAM protein [Rikenellaceae bacterium]